MRHCVKIIISAVTDSFLKGFIRAKIKNKIQNFIDLYWDFSHKSNALRPFGDLFLRTQ
jgi:hypothetical protein